MKIKETKLKKLMCHAYGRLRRSGIPKYSSKYSPRKYTQHQHCAIVVYKKRMKATYRDSEEFLKEMPNIAKILSLDDIPDHSSMQKFLERISESWIYGLILKTEKEIEILEIVRDGTGLRSSYSSAYYESVLQRKKQFIKMVIVIDPGNQKILNILPGIGPGAEQKFLKPLLQPIVFGKLRYAAFDKGYDSNENFEWLLQHTDLPLIAIKGTPGTKFRKQMRKLFEQNTEFYHKRVLSEAVFSVMKRKFGDYLYSRKPELKNKEMLFLSLAYNYYVDTRNISFFLEVFDRA